MSIFGKKKQNQQAQSQLLGLDGRSIQYVTERDGNQVESVLGKAGRLNIVNRHIVIVCDGHEVFRCKLEGAQASELMSLNGVVLSGVDDSGNSRKVVAYYSYYR